ncbi:MAG: hypothetical protein U0Q22_09000 [Acidimicrobiales bacterium]
MSTSFARTRVIAAVLIGLVGLAATACVPEPAPYYGITFNAPGVGYVGKTFTPTATATSGLPVSLALDALSTGCSFVAGVVHFDSVGSCVINADQAGDATHDPSPRVQRTIAVHTCPVMRSGVWSGPLNLTANVAVSGSTFSGYVDLSSMGYGVQSFGGSISCEVVSMTFNGTPLTGALSFDGNVLSSNYNGIDITLYAPAA